MASQGRQSGGKRPRRLLNRTALGTLVLAAGAAALLFRMLRPYWEEPQSAPETAAPAPVEGAESDRVELLDVIDGDTIRVRYRGENERVRLLHIDTPERGENGYREATRALEELLGDGPVEMVFERPGRPARDRYGRLLAYVLDEQGRNASELMVRRGWSTFWTRYGRGRLAAKLERAENEARAEGAGLWGPRGWNEQR
ncbi:MAG: thermonuclease family protein [Polyangia bacterium]